MNNVLVDTGFWFALYDEKDQYHNKALKVMDRLVNSRFLIPFPTLYETLNTSFAKNRNLRAFHLHISLDTCVLVHDEKYKMSALDKTFESSLNRRPLSLVDMIIRHMLDDVDLHIDGLISFNPGDFIDVCYRKGIELISHQNI